MKQVKLLTVGLAVVALATSLLVADEKHEKQGKQEKAKPYPLKTCVVSDEKLDSMGDPYVYKHEGREVKFCCKSCLKDFKKDPAKYLKKLDAAEKAEKAPKK